MKRTEQKRRRERIGKSKGRPEVVAARFNVSVDTVYKARREMTQRPFGHSPLPPHPGDASDMNGKSWFCHSCKVEVYSVRCPHCGKTRREKV